MAVTEEVFNDEVKVVDRLNMGRTIRLETKTGFPFVIFSRPDREMFGIGDTMYVTPCCTAAVTYDEHGTLYCKKCYEAVNPGLDAPGPTL